MGFIEIEFKYIANNVTLTDFLNFIDSQKYNKKIEVSSWDWYFCHKNDKEKFIRYREGASPELTIKRKTVTGNNWKRVEVDLPLDRDRTNIETIRNWIELEGYSFNFKINKSCFIFWVGNINIVYYIVYDENMNESSRFIEIEYDKDKVSSLGNLEIDELKKWESKLSSLGISSKNRMKRSLFEIYRK